MVPFELIIIHRLPRGIVGILAGCFGVVGVVLGMFSVGYFGVLGYFAGFDLGFHQQTLILAIDVAKIHRQP